VNSRRESGSCFYGAIAAVFDGQPLWNCYDHDDDCLEGDRKSARCVAYRPTQFHLKCRLSKAFSKIKAVTRTFYSDRGTSIGYFSEGLDCELYIAIGFLNNPERFPP
jgi:hypothetical protein